MGKLQHLERLALGRSPFQGAASEEVEGRSDDLETTGQQASAGGRYQFDSKGRPVNPVTEQHNQAMRNAQNAVLSLVGVVESTDALSRDLALAARQVQLLRARLLAAEQDRGEDFDLLAPLLHSVFTWWPETLMLRVQAGIFAGSLSFVGLLQREVGTARLGGTRGIVNMLLQGLPIWLLFHTLKTLLGAGLGEGIGQLQQMLNKRMSRKSMNQVNRIIKISCEFIPIAIDIVFLPLQYLAFSQSLGLSSAWSPLSDWRLLLPWNTSSLNSTIWTPTCRSAALAKFTSPAAVMLLKNFLERDQGEGLPIGHQFTSFEWPAINAPRPITGRLPLKLHHDPFGRLLYQCYLVRVKVLRWLGWDLEHVNGHADEATKYQNNRAFPPQPLSEQETTQSAPGRDSHAWTPRYRSTSLAHEPIQYISDRIDGFFTRLLILPVDSLVARTVARSYLLSTWSKPWQADEAAAHVYLPFGGGPLSTIRNHGFGRTAWREIGMYADRLGLSLALTCVGEVGVFFIVYGFCRWQGVDTFDWGDGIRSRQPQIKKASEDSGDEFAHEEEEISDRAARPAA